MQTTQTKKLSFGKKVFFSLMLLAITGLCMFVVGEVVLRVFSPVEYLYPRYKYSAQYGFTLFEDRRMVHSIPGKYKFYYEINELGYRGPLVEVAADYARTNIIVLGDSYSFGMGVDEGEEFSRGLSRTLGDAHDVVNLGTPGWGLTQQVRRYYDFGSQYKPKYVVLQFCSNDPEDNFNNMVTRVENGDLVFTDATGGINWSKKFLSDSVLQKSQLYNFFRGRGYIFVKNLLTPRAEKAYTEQPREAAGEVNPDVGQSPKEAFYNELLGAFAARLAADDVQLVVIAINGQLEHFPGIRDNMMVLDRAGSLHYVEVLDWFEGVTDYRSPEGHIWGAKGHAVVAAGLAEVIRELESEGISN
jgi:hypothetical protein